MASDMKVFNLNVPGWGALQVPQTTVFLVGLGIVTFVGFFLADPFRIIAKVDERLVRLYRVPEKGSAVKGQRFICLVNPFSGNRDGLFQYHKVAHKLLMRAGAESVTMLKTTHPGHFEELGFDMATKFLNGETDAVPDGGVLIFGGDGSLNEFVNGIVKAATKGSMDLNDENAKRALKAIKFTHIPVGSANGVAISAGAPTCYQAIVQIIEGNDKKENTVDMDLNQVSYKCAKTGELKKFVDVHIVSWGLIAEFDDLIERKWRNIGKTLKMALAPVKVVLNRTSHKGSISFKPLDLTKEQQKDLSDRFGYEDPSQLEDHPTKEGWKIMSGNFLMASAASLPWISIDCTLGPDMKFDDGALSLLVISDKASRLELARILTAAAKGKASSFPSVSLFKVSAVHIESEKPGCMGATGEPIETTSLLVESVGSVARYLKA